MSHVLVHTQQTDYIMYMASQIKHVIAWPQRQPEHNKPPKIMYYFSGLLLHHTYRYIHAGPFFWSKQEVTVRSSCVRKGVGAYVVVPP